MIVNVITIVLLFLPFRYHRLFQQGFKLVTFYRDCAKFWTQLINGKEHILKEPRTTATASSCPSQETLDILTQGTIEVKAKNTCGGDVACILSLLATNKVRKSSAQKMIPNFLYSDPEMIANIFLMLASYCETL